MSGKNKYRSANEYLQYLKGDLSNQERHTFERDLEADPFEKEALEGLGMLTPDQAEEDILSLHSRMRKRLGKKRRIAWYSAAASIASLLIIGTIFLQVYDFNPEATEKSLNEEAFSPAPSRSSEGSVPDEIATEEVPEKTEKVEKVEPGIPEQMAIDEAKPSEDLAKGPAKGQSQGPARDPSKSFSKAVKIQTAETPIAEGPDTKTAVPEAEAVVEDIEPVMITYHEAEATPAPMEEVTGREETRQEETGRRAKRRSERLQKEQNQFVSREVSGVAASEEDMKLDTLTLDEEVIVVRQQGNQSGNIRSAQPSVGDRAFKQYIETNIQFPEVETTTNRVVVILKFTVTSAGEIKNFITVRSSGELFTQEAIRLIKEGPSWNPATDDNGVIEEIVRIRIVFSR